MPFFELIHRRRTIDCLTATFRDVVRVTLKDGSTFKLRLMPELTDGLETKTHVRLHLDKFLSQTSVFPTKTLEEQAFPELTTGLSRTQKQGLTPSAVQFFCWADDDRLWSGDGEMFELVAWIRLPNAPLCYEPNHSVSLNSSLKKVEFLTI